MLEHKVNFSSPAGIYDRVEDLQRRVRENRRKRDRSPGLAGVDEVNNANIGVSAQLPSSVLPGQVVPGAVSTASYVQVRRPERDQEPNRTKFHEAIGPLDVYRSDAFSPAYLKPDEGIWEQAYLSKSFAAHER